jgi:hypothetical protein
MNASMPNDPLSLDIFEENRRLRWLRVQSDLLKAVLYQDRDLNLAEARRIVYEFRRRVLEVFPGDERTFDMLLLPRFERVIRERWGQDLDPMIH